MAAKIGWSWPNRSTARACLDVRARRAPQPQRCVLLQLRTELRSGGLPHARRRHRMPKERKALEQRRPAESPSIEEQAAIRNRFSLSGGEVHRGFHQADVESIRRRSHQSSLSRCYLSEEIGLPRNTQYGPGVLGWHRGCALAGHRARQDRFRQGFSECEGAGRRGNLGSDSRGSEGLTADSSDRSAHGGFVCSAGGAAGAESSAYADDKHGHEWVSSEGSPPDLQYACTFELPETRDCGGASDDCDCASSDKTKSPLCQDPATGAYSTIQRRAKGYPGLRELEVLRGIGAQGIVASICPSNTTHPENPKDYGYRPAIEALVERLRGALRYRCLPRPLAIAGDGSVPCVVLEAFAPTQATPAIATIPGIRAASCPRRIA